jgi:hypothetical protein
MKNKIRFTLWLAFGFTAGAHAHSIDTSLLYTNLPLILINTDGKTITDDPKITAGLKIIYKGPSALNHPSDAGNVYDGLCGIEYRGQYSQELPQKPYGFETRDETGNNRNISLLGMPPENDWILLANYNDKTFMRNTLAFHLFSAMGHYAPRARFCEVVLNGRYDGIYVFTEKIKQDDHRVDIAGLDEDDNAGDSLTGGYMFKTDYYDESNSWLSGYSPIDRPGGRVHFVYSYPEPDEITTPQKNYLQHFVNSFETVLYSAGYNDPLKGYPSYLNTASFIDYFIIGELSRNVDAYKKSAFFFKDKDSNGGLLNRGPVWDFDWAWKNMNDNCDIFSATDGSGWAYKVNECNNWPVAPAWMVRLMQDNDFQDELFTRYTALRKTVLSEETLNSYIDSIALLVDDAQTRHYEKWPILGINVGTPEVDYQPDSYDGEIVKFKNWIKKRLSWLDANMPGELIVSNSDALTDHKTVFRLFPNPVSDLLYLESDQVIQKIEVYTTTGTLVIAAMTGDYYASVIDVSRLTPGLYIAKTMFKNNAIVTRRFVVD